MLPRYDLAPGFKIHSVQYPTATFTMFELSVKVSKLRQPNIDNTIRFSSKIRFRCD